MTELNKEKVKDLLKRIWMPKYERGSEGESFDLNYQTAQYLLGLSHISLYPFSPYIKDDDLKLLGITLTFDRNNNEFYRFQSRKHFLELRQIIQEYSQEQEQIDTNVEP